MKQTLQTGSIALGSIVATITGFLLWPTITSAFDSMKSAEPNVGNIMLVLMLLLVFSGVTAIGTVVMVIQTNLWRRADDKAALQVPTKAAKPQA